MDNYFENVHVENVGTQLKIRPSSFALFFSVSTDDAVRTAFTLFRESSFALTITKDNSP